MNNPNDQSRPVPRMRQLEILRQVNMELAHHLKMDYVLAIALDAAVRLGNAHAGAIHLVEDEKFRVAQVIGDFPTALLNAHVPLDQGLIGRAFRLQKAEMVLDVQADPDYAPNIAQTRAQISLPLIADDIVIGVLNIQTSKPERFTNDVFQFEQLLAAHAAMALRNAQLFTQSQTQLVKLKGLYDKVSELEKLKSDMIRVAAHDLRNPLTNIVTGFELLKLDLPAELVKQREELLTIISDSIKRMKRITTDILSLEKIEQMAQAQHRIIDLVETVQRVHREYTAQAAEKNQTFSLHISGEKGAVLGDASHLYEAVANLVGNAIKYTPEGGQVDITLEILAKKAVFQVRDTGYGIREKDQANLFQPFFRSKSEQTQHIEGTGLGLHLVKRIIERHNGELSVQSIYGQGSTFGFELPLSPSASRPA